MEVDWESMILKEVLKFKGNCRKSRISTIRIKTLIGNTLSFVETNANFVYCFVCKEVLSTDHDGYGYSHSGVVFPPHSQVADLLPGFPGWVPREHRGEGVAIEAAGDVDEVSNHGGS